MKLHRRTLLKVAAAAAAAWGGGAFARGRGCALLAGLATDDAFAHGTGAARRLAFRADAAGYAALVQALHDARGDEVMALVEPPQALLIEQAARDSGTAVITCQRLVLPNGDALRLAGLAGRQLAAGANRVDPPFAGDWTLVAIHLRP